MVFFLFFSGKAICEIGAGMTALAGLVVRPNILDFYNFFIITVFCLVPTQYVFENKQCMAL